MLASRKENDGNSLKDIMQVVFYKLQKMLKALFMKVPRCYFFEKTSETSKGQYFSITQKNIPSPTPS